MSAEELYEEVQRALSATPAAPTPEPTYEYVAPSVPDDLGRSIPVSQILLKTPVPTAVAQGVQEGAEKDAARARPHPLTAIGVSEEEINQYRDIIRRHDVNLSAIIARGYNDCIGYVEAVIMAALFVIVALLGYRKIRKR